MRPSLEFMAALEAVIEAESDSDSDDEPSLIAGGEAEIAGSKHWSASNTRRIWSRSMCKPRGSIPEAISVC